MRVEISHENARTKISTFAKNIPPEEHVIGIRRHVKKKKVNIPIMSKLDFNSYKIYIMFLRADLNISEIRDIIIYTLFDEERYSPTTRVPNLVDTIIVRNPD